MIRLNKDWIKYSAGILCDLLKEFKENSQAPKDIESVVKNKQWIISKDEEKALEIVIEMVSDCQEEEISVFKINSGEITSTTTASAYKRKEDKE